MGALEGALRLFPNLTWNIGGYTVALNVVIPALLPLGIIFTAAAMWPFIERWVTGDHREHHICERPRNAPTRTALGLAAIAFYGVLWAEGANDIIAYQFNISLYLTTWVARFAVILAPIAAYIVTKRICLGLQRKDVELLTHGVETGIIRQLPNGEYVEATKPLPEDMRWIVAARTELPHKELPRTGMVGTGSTEDVPAKADRGALGRLRAVLYRAMTESIPLPDEADGHGDGHEAEHAAVGAGDGRGLPHPAGAEGSHSDRPDSSAG
jgi:ubiquinol-cytochrome c reductase cytochrome b subunit